MARLAGHRPVAVVKAELNAAVVVGSVWQRSKHCTDITLDESRAACAEVLRLRHELATTEAADDLESKVVAGRTQLATMAVTGADMDPQATVLANLIGVDQAQIRAGIALLLAFILEVGSALGFAIITTAAKDVPSPATPHSPLPPRRSTTRHASPAHANTAGDEIRSWALSRLDIDAGAFVPARRAYKDYCGWARSRGIEPSTETCFGRQFTKEITVLGGHKKRMRRGTVYAGVSLATPSIGVLTA
jgi:hypothetical protein